jgi:hypothetical protein
MQHHDAWCFLFHQEQISSKFSFRSFACEKLMFLCSILDLERRDDGFSYGNNVSVLQQLFWETKCCAILQILWCWVIDLSALEVTQFVLIWLLFGYKLFASDTLQLKSLWRSCIGWQSGAQHHVRKHRCVSCGSWCLAQCSGQCIRSSSLYISSFRQICICTTAALQPR